MCKFLFLLLFTSSCSILTLVDNALAQVALKRIVGGLSAPVLVLELPTKPNILLVVEQGGRVKVVRNRKVQSQPFLDISEQISIGSEQGLLGLAFDPNFKRNRRFFLSYTRRDGSSVISSMRVDPKNPLIVRARSEAIRLVVSQPFQNHNGGHITFGPDGFLYVGIGDGGSGGDPQNNAQDLSKLLGKILRLDVSAARGYKIPSDNPLRTVNGARPEIFVYGVRNPWRFSFDPVTKRLFIGDVGQNQEEEISIASGGDNLGWRIKEGSQCFDATLNCARDDLRDPIATYLHQEGQSVTGGHVYRGRRLPELSGRYLFADFVSGILFQAVETGQGRWERSTLLSSGMNISSFGIRSSQELMLVDYSGAIFELGNVP
jgi:glucose/arabinose dehydrogenase